MKIAVHGSSGRIGSIVAKTLCEMGHQVVGFDSVKTKLEHQNFEQPKSPWWKFSGDICVTCLPYKAVVPVADWHTTRKIPFFDINGHEETDKQINQLAEERQSPVFSGLGLAPGWIGIQACSMIKQYNVKDLTMYVGGLPAHPFSQDPIKWSPTWSVDGAIANLREKCSVLRKGIIKTKEALSSQEVVFVEDNHYEAANTSGGIGHVLNFAKDQGLENCSYKTLRYPGHYNLIRHLIDCGLSDEELKKVMLHHKYMTDKVLMKIKCGPFTWSRKVSCTNVSAMARSTAMPLCAVVQNFIDNKLPNKSLLSYEDVNIESYYHVLDYLLEKY